MADIKRGPGSVRKSRDFRAISLTPIFQRVTLLATYDRIEFAKPPPRLCSRQHVRAEDRRPACAVGRGRLRPDLAREGQRRAADRRELLGMLKALAPDDMVTVTRIDRLARSTFDLFAIVSRSWTRAGNSGHWPSRGPTPPPEPDG